jgi:thiazole synthase ThiGH ThiG subunit
LRPIYRSRAVLAAPVLLYLVVEAWLALGIDGRGCPQVITSEELVPVVITLGAGVLGASTVLVAGAIRRRGDLLVLAASLGVAVVVGLLAFIGTQSAFYCM